RLYEFSRMAEAKNGVSLPDYEALWRWSVTDIAAFWDSVWDYGCVIGDKGDAVLKDADKMPGARFFPDAKINFAEILLRRRDDSPALIFRTEKGPERRIRHGELYDLVSRWAAAFRAAGVGPGDRV